MSLNAEEMNVVLIEHVELRSVVEYGEGAPLHHHDHDSVTTNQNASVQSNIEEIDNEYVFVHGDIEGVVYGNTDTGYNDSAPGLFVAEDYNFEYQEVIYFNNSDSDEEVDVNVNDVDVSVII